jgi:hypothetical protein
MNNDVVGAAQRLGDILAAENDALKRADYAAAVALGSAKEAALAALSAHTITASFPQALARRLRDLAAQNQEQLALAITVQTRVVQIVARAHVPPKAEARYAARAGKPAPYRAAALAVSTRA